MGQVMETVTIVAADSRIALDMVMSQLGPDAVILSTRRHEDGVEITAGVEGGTRLPPRQRLAGQVDPMTIFLGEAKALGFDPAFVDHMLGAAPPAAGAADLWARFLGRVEDAVALLPQPHRSSPHLCVVGDSGSGKTTTLSQLAVRCREAGQGKPVALVCGDTLKLGASEQLRLIGQLLDLPVFRPEANMTLATLVSLLAPDYRLLIDMPSDIALSHSAAIRLKGLLGRDLSLLCTLPATAQLARHRQLIARFGDLVDGLVVTHAGETLPPGGLVTALAEAGLPLAYVGASPDLLEGLDDARRVDTISRMVVKALFEAGSAVRQ